MRHRGSTQRAGRWTATASTLLLALSAALLLSVLPGRVAPETGESGQAQPYEPRSGRVRHPGIVGQPTLGRGRPEAAPDWRTVLAALDRRRAAAYAAADPAALRRVYVARTTVLRQDRALLLQYRRRGLRVVGMRMRVLGVRVRARRRDRVVLVVRERLVRATVRGAATRRLVDGDVDEHVLTLRDVAGRGWRVASVRERTRGRSRVS